MPNVLKKLRTNLLEAVGLTEEYLGEGGPGSGHFGHKGRKGLVGGSVSSGGKRIRGEREVAVGVKGVRYASPERASKVRKLKGSPVASTKKLRGGVNRTELVTMKDGSQAVFKPKSGEDAGLRPDIDAGTYYKREVAASEVAELVGMDDIVPATTFREIGEEVGSLQEFVEHAQTANQMEKLEDRYGTNQYDVTRAAAFDFVIGNTDRHWGNHLVTDSGKIQLIDHGLAFPSRNSILRSRFIEAVRGDQIPPAIKEMWKGKLKKVRAILRRNGIGQDAMKATGKRYESLLNSNTLADAIRRSGARLVVP